MKTISINLYSFNELSEEAKQKAIDKWYEYEDFPGFYNDLTESLKSKYPEFLNPVLSYSLSYCQGDGLSFKADKYTKLKELFIEVLGPGKEKTAALLANNCTQILKGNTGRYCYASRSDIDLYLENYTSSINCTNTNNIDTVIEKVRIKLEDIYLSACKDIEKEGYSIIEYRMNFEEFNELCEANEYTFEESGKMNNG